MILKTETHSIGNMKSLYLVIPKNKRLFKAIEILKKELDTTHLVPRGEIHSEEPYKKEHIVIENDKVIVNVIITSDFIHIIATIDIEYNDKFNKIIRNALQINT